MKKLILLAVVVFGFAATSFAQVSAGAGANGVINLPSVAAVSINWVQDMDFGTITNNATTNILGDAILELLPTGAYGVKQKLTTTGTPKAAKFLVKNCANLIPGDLTLTHFSDQTLSGGNVWFETSSASTANPILNGLGNNVNYTGLTQVAGTTDQWFITVGGVLLMNKLATGGFNVAGVTVTVNNH